MEKKEKMKGIAAAEGRKRVLGCLKKVPEGASSSPSPSSQFRKAKGMSSGRSCSAAAAAAPATYDDHHPTSSSFLTFGTN